MTLKHVFRLQSLMAVLTVSFMLSCCKTTGGNHHGQGPSAYSVIDGDSIIASYVMEFNADVTRFMDRLQEYCRGKVPLRQYSRF